ncbi:MAG TPA: DUF58 domain-containing protein [Polyangiaceae bacterium]|nr:DUF58 domain-containing protein [Polyangiaceae bacterium]
MIVPTPRFLLLAAVSALPLAAFGGTPPAAAFAVAWNLLLVVFAAFDATRIPSPSEVQVTRTVPGRIFHQVPVDVGFTVRNTARLTVRFQLTDDLPAGFSRTELVSEDTVEPSSRLDVSRVLVAESRGAFELGDVHVRFGSPLGLVVRTAKVHLKDPVKVFPAVGRGSRGPLDALRRHPDRGARPSRGRGEGSDFESLRDYVPGDDPGDIAWKATARRTRLTTRNYEPDRSQVVLVVLDSGRLMATEVEGKTRLDHAVEATLRLAFSAAAQGDSIGVLAASDEIEAYVPPVRGKAALPRLNEALYRLEPRPRETSYERACGYLALRHRKRSLIVVVTDLVDNEASSALLSHLARFSRRHVALCVVLRNLDLERLAGTRPETAEDAYAQTVALDLLERRRVAIEHMERSGVDVLDVDPRALGPRLVTRYLALRKRVA